jgi:hypothetical protein
MKDGLNYSLAVLTYIYLGTIEDTRNNSINSTGKLTTILQIKFHGQQGRHAHYGDTQVL